MDNWFRIRYVFINISLFSARFFRSIPLRPIYFEIAALLILSDSIKLIFWFYSIFPNFFFIFAFRFFFSFFSISLFLPPFYLMNFFFAKNIINILTTIHSLPKMQI